MQLRRRRWKYNSVLLFKPDTVLTHAAQAGLKLAASKGVPVTASIAPSWATALGQEFEKAYFKKVGATLKSMVSTTEI